MTGSGDDAQRFEALYRAHYPAVARFVVRRTTPEAAEEALAEIFAITWRRLSDVPADPLPWLYVTARHVLLGEQRTLARGREKAGRAALERVDRPRDPAETLAERDVALRALLGLTEADREALRLTAWDGLDHRAAARVLGISRVAFTMRVSRARRRLAAALVVLDADPVVASLRPPDPSAAQAAVEARR